MFNQADQSIYLCRGSYDEEFNQAFAAQLALVHGKRNPKHWANEDKLFSSGQLASTLQTSICSGHTEKLLSLGRERCKEESSSLLGSRPLARGVVNTQKTLKHTKLQTIQEECAVCDVEKANWLQSPRIGVDAMATEREQLESLKSHQISPDFCHTTKTTLQTTLNMNANKVAKIQKPNDSHREKHEQRQKRQLCVKISPSDNKRTKRATPKTSAFMTFESTPQIYRETRSLCRLKERKSKGKHRSQRREARQILRKLLYTHLLVTPIESENLLMEFLKKDGKLALLPLLIPSLTRVLFKFMSTAKRTYGANAKAYACSLFALLRVCASTCASLKTLYLVQLRAGSNSPTMVKGIDTQKNRKYNRDLHEEVRSTLSQIERKMMTMFQNWEQKPPTSLSVPRMKVQ